MTRGMSQLGEGEKYEEVSFVLAVLQKYGETQRTLVMLVPSNAKSINGE